MANKWDIKRNNYFFMEVVGKQSEVGRQARTILEGNISRRCIFERGMCQFNKNLFFMHFLWHKMWKKSKEMSGLEYGSIAGK